MIWGMVCLLLGSVADFAMPLYMGLVIDQLEANNMAGVIRLCIELIVIVVVSTPFVY